MKAAFLLLASFLMASKVFARNKTFLIEVEERTKENEDYIIHPKSRLIVTSCWCLFQKIQETPHPSISCIGVVELLLKGGR